MKKAFLLVVLSSFILSSCNNSNQKEMNKAGYVNADSFGKASIIRDKDTKIASLTIDTDGQWTLYGGTSVDNIDLSTPIIKGEGSGTYPIAVSDSVRYYFQLVTPNSKVLLSEQHLPMTGGYNFRDLGGIKTVDGRYIKWGKLFRSDDLHNLLDTDLSYLSSIPLISIVDFRSEEEMTKAPDKIPASVKEDYKYSISPGNLMDAKNLMKLSEQQLDSAMMDMNILLVTDTACINEYKKFFSLLQDENEIPLMYHCSAGKDRTGMATALILYALGVDEKTIADDYLLSNVYLGDKYAEYKTKYPNLKPLFEVKPEFLKAGIDRIKKDHKTVENYLTNVLGVDIQKMKDIYLY